MQTYKISSKTDVAKLCGAILAALRTDGRVALVAVGPRAMAKAVQGLALARGHMLAVSTDIAVFPAFQYLRLDDGSSVRAVRFAVKEVPVEER